MPATNAPNPAPRNEIASLQPAYEAGSTFRTTRTLRVEELTETERFVTEGDEVTLTRVLNVDERGRLLVIERTYELAETRFVQGFGEPKPAQGDLHGCTLELRRRQGGADAKLIAGEADIGRQAFLMDGFELALLPIDPVREADRWTLSAQALSGLNKFVEAIGLKIDKNRLACVVSSITPERAEIALDWSLSGEFKESTAVMQFDGSLVFDRKQKLVSEFKLSGGRQGSKQQIEIKLKRRLTNGWHDLDE
jgi:hypothetical protein